MAPRAKMNQQRSRRFRAAQLAQIERDASERVAYELAGRNCFFDHFNIYLHAFLSYRPRAPNGEKGITL